MIPAELQGFNQAISLAQAGRKEEAHLILMQLAQTNPDDYNLLLWLAFTSSDLSLARIWIDRVAQQEPANPSLASARSWLIEQETRQAREASVAAQPVGAGASAGRFSGYQSNPGPTADFGHAQPYAYSQPQPAPASTGAYDNRQLYSTDEAATGRSRSFLLPVVGLIAGVVIVAIIAIVAITFLSGGGNSDKIAAKGLPVYSGATRLTLSEAEQKTLMDSFAQNTDMNKIQDLAVEFYSIKREDKPNVISYYDNQIKNQGWIAPKGSSLSVPHGSVNVYTRDNDTKAVLVVTASIAKNNNDKAFLKDKIKPEELLLFVMYAEEKKS
ncbi:MAG TPA: hypothetical protein VH186_18880 [Chloroflexia bacterium]|nr:hypothetical protein [Chloroflexia bacterium]